MLPCVPRENHRQRLLDGALRCIAERGYAHTSARDIAEAAGANLGSIGYHFGSKEALLREALRAGFTAWLQQLRAASFDDADSTPLERLDAALRGLAASVQTHRPLMVAFLSALAESDRSEELRRDLAELYVESRTYVGRLVQTALGDPPLDDDHAAAMAGLLLAAGDGLLLQWMVDPKRSPGPQALTDGIVAALGRLLLPVAPPAAAADSA
jgi:AcrR family transcriptional regulator